VSLLEVDDVVVRYGRAVAVDGVSLRIAARERVALIGPNGAGKTSLLNAVCGVVRPAAGHVRVDGDDVTGATPAAVVRRGISQVPEGRHVFATLPVEANLLLGAYGRLFSLEIVSSTLRYVRSRSDVRDRLERVYDLLPQLRDLRERAGTDELPDGVAAVEQPSLGAIDEGQAGLPRDDALETRRVRTVVRGRRHGCQVYRPSSVVAPSPLTVPAIAMTSAPASRSRSRAR